MIPARWQRLNLATEPSRCPTSGNMKPIWTTSSSSFSSVSGKALCILCHQNSRSAALVPCGHSSFCYTCALTIAAMTVRKATYLTQLYLINLLETIITIPDSWKVRQLIYKNYHPHTKILLSNRPPSSFLQDAAAQVFKDLLIPWVSRLPTLTLFFRMRDVPCAQVPSAWLSKLNDLNKLA